MRVTLIAPALAAAAVLGLLACGGGGANGRLAANGPAAPVLDADPEGAALAPSGGPPDYVVSADVRAVRSCEQRIVVITRNVGGAATGPSWTHVRLYDGHGSSNTEFLVPALRSGGQFRQRLVQVSLGRPADWEAIADYYGQVAESDEGNNTAGGPAPCN